MIGATALLDAGQLELFDGVGNLVQVLLGQVQIPGCHFQILMAEQKLDVRRSVPASSRWVAQLWRTR